MKSLTQLALTALIWHSAVAYAAPTTQSPGISLIAKIFLVFFAAIIAFQMIPALVLFGGLLVAIFKRVTGKGEVLESE